MPRPWTRSKKLRRACGGNPREARTRHTGRGLVSRRDAGGPKEQAHLSLGQERFTPPCRPRSTDPIDLSVWCGLSRTWSRRRPRGSEQYLTRAAAAARTRTQRPGKHLAVHASELVVKPDFQILRRYRRPLLLRLEHTHRPALEDYVHRATRLGSSRSLNLRIGISHCDSTHGHHPCLLSFAFNVRPSHEFPCMRGTRGRAPCAKGGMRRGVRSLNDA